jgi:hypothetical protein
VEGGDQKTATRLGSGPTGYGPAGSARPAADPRPVARPAHGLGPVARPVVVASRATAATAEPPPVADDRSSAPMSPPIARSMRPVIGPPPSNGGGAAGVVAMARGAWPRGGPGALAAGRTGFGLPNLRRNVCPHFYLTGIRGAMPVQAPHLLKALVRQEQNVSRCQLRGGVHLEQGYVNDVCLSARFNQCVFYEDDLGS